MRRPRTAGFLLGVLAMSAVVTWTGCGSIPDGWEGKPGPPRVLTTFPPIYCFTQNVAGDGES